MLAYYLTAAIAFTLGFLAAAAITAGRRSQTSRDQAWLVEAIERFAAKCRKSPQSNDEVDRFVVERKELEALEEAARNRSAEFEK